MIELSCFVDESGDFGKYEKHSPYYLLTLVFHEQDKSIDLKDFKILDKNLQKYFPEEGNFKERLIKSAEKYFNDDTTDI